MKSVVLVFSLLFVANVAWSDDQFTAPVYAKKIDGLLNRCQPRVPREETVFTVFLRGNAVFDGLNNRGAGDLWLDTMELVAKERGYKMVGRENLWWGIQFGVCKKIVEAKPDKIVILGHSAGADGARNLTQCLKKAGRDVDVLITFAGFDYSKPVTEEGVLTQFNYVVKTAFIAGSEKESNGKSKTINYHTQSDSAGWAHYEGPTLLAGLFALQTYAELEGMSDKMVVGDHFVAQTAQTNLEDFLPCEP